MYICIDIGGTKISAALVQYGKIIERRKIDSPIHKDVTKLMPLLFDLCAKWESKATHIAIACTGLVGNNMVNMLSVKTRIPIKQLLEEKYDLPVTILNDAAAAAWAEYHHLKEERPETLVYVTVSTGIGGGIIQNGQLVTSSDGFSAHLGHVSVPSQSSIICHCGLPNCIEALSSGTAIGQRGSKILNKEVSAKELFENHYSNPEVALLIKQCAKDLVSALASIKATTGTSVIVLGGSVGLNDIFRKSILEHINNLPLLYQFTLLSPQCGVDADLLGVYHFANRESHQCK